MAKYRLKKDTPNFRAGELFTVHLTPDKIFPQDSDAIYDPHGDYYDSRGNINDFFDWFEKVEEGVEWLHDGASYYQPAVSGIARKFVPSYDEYCGDDAYDVARRRIGICYRTEKACQRFIDFLTAVEVVSHDEGFMKQDKIYGKVWVLRRAYLESEGLFAARNVPVGFHNPGAFYFDTEEHAIASSERHPNQWQTILNYDWSKGEDEEDED